MALDVSRINSIDKRNISFKAEVKDAETKAPAEETVPVEEEEETSFYQRNKKILLATGAIAAVGIAIATRHHFKTKNVKDIKIETKTKLEDFKNRLNSCKKEEDTNELVKLLLSEDDPKLKMQAIDHMVNYVRNGKDINANNWEDIMQAIYSTKPTDPKDQAQVTINASRLFMVMRERKLVTPEVLDKMIAKLPDTADELKLNVAERMIESYHVNSERFESQLSESQIKKVLTMLDDVKTQEFEYRWGAYTSSEGYTRDGVKYSYHSKYFSDKTIDEDYLKEIKTVLNDTNLPEDARLQIIGDVISKKYVSQKAGDTKEGAQLAREFFEVIFNAKTQKYSRPNTSFKHESDTFDLANRVLKHAVKESSDNFTTTEHLDIIRKLKEMSKKVEIKTGILGNASDINRLSIKELELKNKLFGETITDKTTISDIGKFVDEMLNDYEEALKNFIKSDKLSDSIDKQSMTINYEMFKLDMYSQMSKRTSFWRDSDEMDKIVEKMENFGEKHFGIKNEYRSRGSRSSSHTGGSSYNYHNRSENSERSRFNYGSFRKNKVTEAKAKLTEFFQKDEDLEDLVELLKKEDMDEATLKKIKRRFSVKYHPDRVQDDETKIKYTQIFQEIYGVIEILEKTIS